MAFLTSPLRRVSALAPPRERKLRPTKSDDTVLVVIVDVVAVRFP